MLSSQPLTESSSDTSCLNLPLKGEREIISAMIEHNYQFYVQ
uniref:Uncharacterized protein n=1 Tax=Rhizophora mucronata TaxID=61149 RepID=A0A2P2IXZ0_RHIMU